MPTFLAPDWGKSQDIDVDHSSLCSTGPSPFILSGILRRLLQTHFSDPDNIANPLLKNVTWSEHSCEADENDGEVQSTISIEAGYADMDLGDIESYPAVRVVRGDVKIGGISIDDKSIDGYDENGQFEGPLYTQLFTGSHSVICIGNTGAESDSIASEVLFRLLHYMKVIKKEFQLSLLNIPGMGKVQKVPKGKDAFQVTITVNWVWMHRWIVSEETPLLKRLSMNMEKSI